VFVVDRGSFGYDSTTKPTATLSGLPAGSYLITAEGRTTPKGGNFQAQVDISIDGTIDRVVTNKSDADVFSVTRAHTFNGPGSVQMTFSVQGDPGGAACSVGYSRIIAVQVASISSTFVSE
jgi:hypothetical protein